MPSAGKAHAKINPCCALIGGDGYRIGQLKITVHGLTGSLAFLARQPIQDEICVAA